MLKEIKSREERVKEGISILKQLKEGGVSHTSMGFIELKQKITEWIDSETGWEGIIPFPEYGRVGEVDLARYNNRSSAINFKVKRG
jgi:hypothetical protein